MSGAGRQPSRASPRNEISTTTSGWFRPDDGRAMIASHHVYRRNGKAIPACLRITFLLLLQSGIVCFASNPPSPPTDRTPIQAELVKVIEAGRTQVGDSVLARVSIAWKNSDCKLREGAILKGRIVTQTPRSRGASSEVAILFETGQCGGRDMKPLPLTVAALLAPDPTSSLYSNQESQPLSEAVGLSLGQAGSGSPMRSMTSAAAAVLVEPPRNKPPQLVMPGQVIGMPDMKLGVGSGPEGSSVLTSEKHNLRLPPGSRLVLVPNLKTDEVPPDANGSAAPGTSPAAPRPAENAEAADETEVCAPPMCSVDLEGSAPTEADISLTAAPAMTMPVRQFGFFAGADREMYSLDHDVAISYLGANRLLFTFNPHILISRGATEAMLPKLHIVRAALIDLTTMKAVRTVDWRVHDAQQYLWSMGVDHVLIHVGGELRMYGPGLKLEQKLALGGPLAFARVSPSGRYIAVGAIRERHSEEVHRQLAEAEDREPEEDVEVKVLDASFHTLATVMRSSRELPPILSDDGEVRLSTIGKNRWRISEHSWTGEQRILKQLDSTCRPEITSVPPDLLFVTGCDRLAEGKWYRMLRPDGKLVLKGSSPSTEQAHRASGSTSNSVFAVGITELVRAIDESSAFHSSDLKDLHVAVYRAEDGKKLTAVTISDPLPTLQTFALSPDGRQLAVLDNSQIVFYALPASASRN
jgi:hypothetical protein